MSKTLTTYRIVVSRCFMFLLFASVVPHALAQPFEQVAVGAAHVCALEASGQVECTTTPIAQRMLPPEDLPLMVDIAAGQQHTCGITVDRSVECWGTDAFGALDVPALDAPVASISSGFNHTCAIDGNGAARCWGLNSNNQLDAPDIAGGFVKVDAGRTASCGIDTVGDIHCWSSDSFFNTDEPIVGPFIDLDIDSNQACGLTVNGDIQCWASRERLGLSPPVNGPYTDLTVTNSAICGLRIDQLLDCSFASPIGYDIDTRSDEYPLEVAFASIERSNQQFDGVPICGVRSDNGTISCFGGSGQSGEGVLPAPPGAGATAAALTASNINLGLTAQIYGPNQVELFWSQLPSVFPPIFVEIYRDDELLLTTSNGFSYYDNDNAVSSDESRYRVRTVDESGNVGEFSNVIIANRLTRQIEVQGNGTTPVNPRPGSVLQVQNVSITNFSQLGVNSGPFILSWSVDNPADAAIAGYEIRIDNEVVDFLSSTSYVGDGASLDICRVYSVAAISEDGAILDFNSIAQGRNAFRCP